MSTNIYPKYQIVNKEIIKTTETNLVFDDIVAIQDPYTFSFYYSSNPNIESVSFPDLTYICDWGLRNCFSLCNALTSASFPSLTTVQKYGMSSTFNASAIISVSFPELTYINEHGMSGLFYYSEQLRTVSFPKLESVLYYGFNDAFSGTAIESIYFPSLTTIVTGAFYGAFSSCDNLTEVHFRSDMRSTVESSLGYDTNFGANSNVFYFDL